MIPKNRQKQDIISLRRVLELTADEKNNYGKELDDMAV